MSGISRTDLWHAQRLFGPKARESGKTADTLAKISVEGDKFAPRVSQDALRALSQLSARYDDVRSIDVDVEAKKMSADAAASFREMFQAVSKLKQKGELSRPKRADTVNMEMVSRLMSGELPESLLRHARKTAGVEVFRLFADPVKDAELHVLAEDHLRRTHRIPRAKLLEAEVKPELTLREDFARKTGASLLLLLDGKLPQNMQLMLLERVGKFADVSAIPALEKIAAQATDPEIRKAAKTAIRGTQKAAKMTIVLATMEVKPYAGTGGLSNVMSELPAALAAMGHRVIVVSPRHAIVDASKLEKTDKGGLVMGGENGADAFTLMKDVRDGVEHYFIENDKYFSKDRPGIYTDGKNDYPDNASRYDFFGAAIPSALQAILGTKRPDVVQLNDAHTASAALYLSLDPSFKDTKTVIAVHNLGGAYQGKFNSAEQLPKMRFANLGVYYPTGPAEYYGDINFLKLGLTKSHAAITVSREYKKEILTKEKGEGLHGVLRYLDARDRLWGNLNGIDTKAWDPAKDPLIDYHYNFTNREGKALNKGSLQRMFKLPEKPNTPVIGVLARLTEQKGFDDILDSMTKALAEKKDVQFVICGDGDPAIRKQIEELAAQYPENVSIADKFSLKIEHMIYAGSDLFLMPSKFEPCGLPQMYALRYSTIPIVRAVGGLEESIGNYDAASKTGNGFKFTDDLSEALNRALDWYGSGAEAREPLLRNAALSDFSWEGSSALEQLAFYRKVIAD
jgi:starch synthase